ncbi:hypothetical protein N5923_22435 [Erwiniaceae bacterium BAC15a-03b]|uniref:Lipoprotein n=1 Tax=Winslowiella arboricola TaxID=2978220 RepID=A0A9J6PXQ8_9GAMM|nr:hypothetical protein [Winslowiella arboricola]MCU5775347.1 hypothetical protein [Winslowiella arboricola]MCU5780256.1 hypothetical protein [Winslowiella arboricola]
MNKHHFFAIVVAMVILTGCASRTEPVHNVEHTISTNAYYSPEQVQAAIVQAGLGRKWAMFPDRPGVINGRLTLRDHSADIRIDYTATSYSINYVSSQNLKAGGGQIHRNYNHWINNLDRDIQLRLSAKTLN